MDKPRSLPALAPLQNGFCGGGANWAGQRTKKHEHDGMEKPARLPGRYGVRRL
jgi:hypothetical protein